MPTPVPEAPDAPLNLQFAHALYTALAPLPQAPFNQLEGRTQARYINLADQTLRHVSFNLKLLKDALLAHNKSTYHMIMPTPPPVSPAPPDFQP